MGCVVVLHRKDHLICSVITFIRFIHDGEWILIQKVRQIIKHCIIYYIMRKQDIYLYFLLTERSIRQIFDLLHKKLEP